MENQVQSAAAPEQSTMTVQEMVAERARWEARIEAAIKEQRAGKIAEVKAIIAAFNLTAKDLGLAVGHVETAHVPGTRAHSPRKGRQAPGTGVVPPKYHDGMGNFWTGRGKKPQWVEAAFAAGKTLQDLLIQPGDAVPTPPAPVVNPEPASAPSVQGELLVNGEPASQEQPAAASDAQHAADVPPNAKYTDGNGQFWHGKFKAPQWVADYLAGGEGRKLDDLLIQRPEQAA